MFKRLVLTLVFESFRARLQSLGSAVPFKFSPPASCWVFNQLIITGNRRIKHDPIWIVSEIKVRSLMLYPPRGGSLILLCPVPGSSDLCQMANYRGDCWWCQTWVKWRVTAVVWWRFPSRSPPLAAVRAARLFRIPLSPTLTDVCSITLAAARIFRVFWQRSASLLLHAQLPIFDRFEMLCVTNVWLWILSSFFPPAKHLPRSNSTSKYETFHFLQMSESTHFNPVSPCLVLVACAAGAGQCS